MRSLTFVDRDHTVELLVTELHDPEAQEIGKLIHVFIDSIHKRTAEIWADNAADLGRKFERFLDDFKAN